MNKHFLLAGAVAGLVLAQAVAAAELTVLSAGAIEPGVKAAVAAFQKDTGLYLECDGHNRNGQS